MRTRIVLPSGDMSAPVMIVPGKRVTADGVEGSSGGTVKDPTSRIVTVAPSTSARFGARNTWPTPLRYSLSMMNRSPVRGSTNIDSASTGWSG